MTFYIKQNDTSPALQATLKDSDNNAVNLTGASVSFKMRLIGGTTLKTNHTATIFNASNGVVTFNWRSSDTDTAGDYQAEFQVTYSDSSIETFPNNGYIRIEIIDDIG